jgi:hypothetical protein
VVIVLSNIANEAAETLVDMFPPGAAVLITASNFNHSFKGGICVNNFSSSRITVNNTTITAGEITGVVTTIPYFFPQEFYYIQPADRDYVCAEMNAFFTYFLAELTCKKLNPPSIRSFTGFSLFKTEWVNVALALSIPVWPVTLKNGVLVREAEAGITGVSSYKYTIVGDVIPGATPPGLISRYMRALQKAFAMPYLQCYFIATGDNEYYLADILSVPDISSALNREAIAGYFIKNSLYDSFMGPDGRRAHEYGTQRV